MPTVAGAGQLVANHPTTAASGLGGSVSIVVMSILLHLNVHLSEEEALAWCSLLIAFLGWFIRFLGKRFPVLDIQATTTSTITSPDSASTAVPGNDGNSAKSIPTPV